MSPESRPSVNPKAIARQNTELIKVFPIIRSLMGIRLRGWLTEEYVLSIISEQQPGLYFMGENQDQISPNQVDSLIEGLKKSSVRWRNLSAVHNPITRRSKRASKDWQR